MKRIAYVLRKVYLDGRQQGVQEDFIYKDVTVVNPSNNATYGLPVQVDTTDDLPEGSKNKYYTEERVRRLVTMLISAALSDQTKPDTPDNPLAFVEHLKNRLNELEVDLETKAETSDLTEMQATLAKMQAAVSSLLGNSNGTAADVQTALIEIRSELAAKVSNQDFIRLLSNRVSSEDLAGILAGYVPKEQMVAATDRINRAYQAIENLQQLLNTPNEDSLLALIHTKASKEDLTFKAAELNSAILRLQQGLSAYATLSQVEALLQEVKSAQQDLATKAELIQLREQGQEELAAAIRETKASIVIPDISGLVTREDFNARVAQEVALNRDALANLASKDQVDSIQAVLKPATANDAGFMSAPDKEKLDSLPVASLIAAKEDLLAVSRRVTYLESGSTNPDFSGYATLNYVDQAVLSLQGSIPKVNLTPYALKEGVSALTNALDRRVGLLEAKLASPPDMSQYATNASLASLASKVNSIVIPSAPSLDHLAHKTTVEELTRSLNGYKHEVSQTYLTKNAFETAHSQHLEEVGNRLTSFGKRLDIVAASIKGNPAPSEPGASTPTDTSNLATKNDVDDLRSSLTTKISGLDLKYGLLESSIQSLNSTQTSRLDTLQRGHTQLASTVSQQGATLVSSTRQVESLQAALRETAPLSSLTSLQREVQGISTRVDLLDSANVQSLTQEVKANTAFAESAKQTLAEMRGKLSVPNDYSSDFNTPESLVSFGLLKGYLDVKLQPLSQQGESRGLTRQEVQALLPARATDTTEGLVRLANQDELRTSSSLAVTTVADVKALISAIPSATTHVSGLMTAAQVAQLGKTASQSDLSNLSSTLQQNIQEATSGYSSRLSSLEQGATNLGSRVSQLESAGQTDLSAYATIASLNQVRVDVENVRNLERVTALQMQTAVSQSEEKITEAYSQAVNQAKEELTSKIQEAQLNNGSGQSVDLSSYAKRSELQALESSIRTDFPVVPDVSEFITKQALEGKVQELTQPLSSSVSSLTQTVQGKANQQDLTSLREQVQGLNIPSIDGLVTESEFQQLKGRVDQFSTNNLNPADYVTKTYLSGQLDTALASLNDTKEEAKQATIAANAAVQKVDQALAVSDLGVIAQKVTALEQQASGFVTNSSVHETVNTLVTQQVEGLNEVYASKAAFETLTTETLPTTYATKQELQAVSGVDVSTFLTSTKAEETYVKKDKLTELQPVPTVKKQELQPGQVTNLDLSDFHNKAIRLTVLLHNEGRYQVVLTQATLSVSGEQTQTGNKTIKANDRLFVKQHTLVPAEDGVYTLQAEGGGVTAVCIVEVLY